MVRTVPRAGARPSTRSRGTTRAACVVGQAGRRRQPADGRSRYGVRGIPALFIFRRWAGSWIDWSACSRARAIEARLQPLLEPAAALAGAGIVLDPSGRPGYDGTWRTVARAPDLEFSAGGLVFDEDGRVLLIRARDLRNQPVWTLPKGALKPGETSVDAALREVQEETGYRCELVRELDGGDVLVPARRPAYPQDGALVPDAAARKGRRARPRGGRGGCGRIGRRPRPGCATTPTAACSPPRPERRQARPAASRPAATDRSRRRR